MQDKICPICNTEIKDSSTRLKCTKCGNADRTRTLFFLYKSILPFTNNFDALIFTEENWLPSNFFKSSIRSLFYGTNHLDIQNIKLNDGSFSWVTCNHILEHVEDYLAAIKEMFRILRTNGVIQITVPMPSTVFKTIDWGFPDENLMGHYRTFGAEFSLLLRSELKNSFAIATFTYDKFSEYKDIAYFLFKDKHVMEALASVLFRSGYISVPF